MRGRATGTLEFLVAVVRTAREKQLTFLAASVAYYALVSLLPLLLLAMSVATAVGGPQLADAVVGAAAKYLSPAGQTLIIDAITSAAGRTTAGLVGAVFLLWSGLKLLRALDIAFSAMYDTLDRSLLDNFGDALVVLVALGLAGAAVVVFGGVLQVALAGVPFGRFLSIVAMVPVLAVFFLPLYLVFPDVPMTVREALPGAVVASGGWTLLTYGYGIYVANVGGFSIYGILGGALLVGVWLYFASIVITLGAVVNVVLAGGTDNGRDDERDAAESGEVDGPAPDITELARDLRAVQSRLDEKTVHRADLESDLKQYVGRRLRRGHARGWGPYLVLLYGTAMTLGAFYWLRGGWSILAMIVVWLSTLGLYVLMLLTGLGIGALSAPGRALDWLSSRRS